MTANTNHVDLKYTPHMDNCLSNPMPLTEDDLRKAQERYEQIVASGNLRYGLDYHLSYINFESLLDLLVYSLNGSDRVDFDVVIKDLNDFLDNE